MDSSFRNPLLDLIFHPPLSPRSIAAFPRSQRGSKVLTEKLIKLTEDLERMLPRPSSLVASCPLFNFLRKSWLGSDWFFKLVSLSLLCLLFSPLFDSYPLQYDMLVTSE